MAHRGSILLIDDEEKILKALGRALRDAGHQVTETTSPREGQRLLGLKTFDVVIVDNVMPQLSGLDLIRAPGRNGSRQTNQGSATRGRSNETGQERAS